MTFFGKFNLVKKIAMHSDENNLKRMLLRQNFVNLPIFTYEMDYGFIGWIGGSHIDGNENLLVFNGEPINCPDFSEIQNYHDIVSLLSESDGAFNAFFYDRSNKKLVIINDFLGLQPLYISIQNKELIAASETKAFKTQKKDLAGWGAFVSLGYLLGGRTLLDGVTRFPPATILIYDLDTKDIEKKTYWRAPKITKTYDIQDVIDSFEESLVRYSDLSPDNSEILLSGGFDSRLILFSLISLGIKPNAIILSHGDEHDDLDGALAEHCAKISDIQYRKIEPPENYFSSRHYLDFLQLSDANTPSLFLFISKILLGFSNQVPDFCWEGFIPGYTLVAPDHYGTDLKSFVASKTENKNWMVLKEIFNKRVIEEMQESYKIDLKNELYKYDNHNNSICEFYTKNKGRHRTSINPLQVYANFTRALLPGMTKDFINLVLAIPYQAKIDHRFYLKMFEQAHPTACRFPFVTAGKLKTTRKNLKYLNAFCRIGLFKFIQNHPSISKPLGLYKDFSTVSNFFNQDLLVDDPAINTDSLKNLAPDDPRYLTAWKMVFHWRAWDLVHGGNVYDLLAEPHTLKDRL